MNNKTADKLSAQYQQRFQNIASYRQALWKVLCEDFFQQFIPAQSTLLDLGCGWGEFINNIAADTKYGLDLNPDAEEKLSANISFLNQDCSTSWPLADDSLDVVFTSNFLEHLSSKQDIEHTIEEAHRCLKPGGTIICVGPNINYLHNGYWDFWDHHIPISDASLTELLKLKHFDIKQQHSKFLPFTMANGRTPNLTLVKWYLKLPLAWKILGKQFLVIGQANKQIPDSSHD